MGSRFTADGSMLLRVRFNQAWDYLPPLTLLIGLPGWGRSTLMRQCEARLLRSEAPTTTRWIGSRYELERRLGDREGGGAPEVWFVDDLLDGPTDSLWPVLADRLRGDGTLRVVVAAGDPPAGDVIASLHPLILDEPVLAFDGEEASALAEQLLIGHPADPVVVPEHLCGCPSLVHRHLEQLRADEARGVWTPPPGAHELALLPALDPVMGDADGHQGLLDSLRAARGLRTFTRDLLRGVEGLSGDWFHRAAAYPLFTSDTDPETGAAALSWTHSAWAALALITPEGDRQRELRAGLHRILASGRVTLALGPLLELGEVDRAERLVRGDFRAFLLFTGAHAEEMLVNLRPDPRLAPALALLLVELDSRRDGGSPEARDVARTAMLTLQGLEPSSFGEEFARTALTIFAAVSAGDRSRGIRVLDHVWELLEVLETGRSRRLTTRQRTRLVGQLYLAYWACLQLDRHVGALRLAGLMVDLSDPADRLFEMERVSLITEQDLAGLRSLGDERPDDRLPSQAAALRLIEEGRDQEALALLRPVFERGGPRQSRSAIDALLLLVRTQTDPVGLGLDDVREAVLRSRRFWRDHRPSSFIAWAATVAASLPGLQPQLDPLAGMPEGESMFEGLTRCAMALRDGRFADALGESGRLDAEGFPRFEVLTHVYAAAAHIGLDNPDAAMHALVRGWRSAPSPRLLRFALRFIPGEIADRLSEVAGEGGARLPGPLRAALGAAAGDPRPLVWQQQRPVLTPTEREILTLMQRGLKNSEIAAERFVTVGTLRSQIKPLYRKLGVGDRAGALEVAVRLRLLSGR